MKKTVYVTCARAKGKSFARARAIKALVASGFNVAMARPSNEKPQPAPISFIDGSTNKKPTKNKPWYRQGLRNYE